MTIPTDEEIHFKFQQHTNVPGNARLPSFFYSGVTFGLTWQNPHDLYVSLSLKIFVFIEHLFSFQFTSKNKLGSKDLKHDLAHFHPRPTHLMKRYSTYENATEISEDGFGIFFSYEDLEKQGKLSSDKLQPWKRILEDILVVARKYRQVTFFLLHSLFYQFMLLGLCYSLVSLQVRQGPRHESRWRSISPLLHNPANRSDTDRFKWH